jgi:hypothetical protein
MTQPFTLDDWRKHFDSLHGAGSAAEFERLLVDQSTTFKAIGDRFGITTQRVSQLVEKHFPMYRRKVAGNLQSRLAQRRRAEKK